jgi:ferredoxin
MPEETKPKESSSVDIFQLLKETTDKDKKKLRKELLAPLGVKQFFAQGTVVLNRRTCKGVECNLCVKACPTNALYWKAGEIGFTEELCIYCGACVLSCIVDDCIKISRKRPDGVTETFSRPRDFTVLQHNINSGRRLAIIREVFPGAEEYIEWRKKKTKQGKA